MSEGKRVWVRRMTTIVDGVIIAEATEGENGQLFPVTYDSAREAATELLQDRISFLQTTLENLVCIEDEDEDDLQVEATDDLDDWIEPAVLMPDGSLVFDGDEIVTLEDFRRTR